MNIADMGGERARLVAYLRDRVRTLSDLLIEAEGLLCDERGGKAANELAARIRDEFREEHVAKD